VWVVSHFLFYLNGSPSVGSTPATQFPTDCLASVSGRLPEPMRNCLSCCLKRAYLSRLSSETVKRPPSTFKSVQA
jgi:hypothetical protein